MSLIPRGPVFRWRDPGQVPVVAESVRRRRVYGLVAAKLRGEQRPDAERALGTSTKLCDRHPPESELVLEWKEKWEKTRRLFCEEHLRHRGGGHL